MFSVIATLHGSALASAPGAPSFFDSFSKYTKMQWFYTCLDALTGPCWTTQGKVKNPKTSATLHGNASQKCKMSTTLHGNAFFVRMVQVGLPRRVPQKRPKPFILRCFRSLLEPHWSTRGAHTKKWSRPSGRQRATIASAQSIYFSNYVQWI